MKLLTYRSAQGPRLGAQVGASHVLDLQQAAQRASADAAPFASMLALIQAGGPALQRARELVRSAVHDQLLALDGLPLEAPLPVPEQIRDFANYELHVKQALASSLKVRASAEADPVAAAERLRASGMFAIPPVWYERPLYYKCNRFSVVGPDADVLWPSYSQRLDYEMELAVVIGRKVRDVPVAEAMDAVFGYTLYNDFTARDTQVQEGGFRMGPAKGKDFDTGNAMGPCIVTRDELPDPYKLRMRVTVNGQVRAETLSGGMQHDIAHTISFLSQSETLYPGEVLAMGTVGNGCGYESLSFLADGDVVEIEAEGIGRLRNRLVRPRRTA
ncbi:MAG TPA: fumarylacetoacetate hydrolase family protein [Ramlibacter sp.]|nr:fumarylacetoacetate hydrolase family protein [Ramlibacter sp.]